MNGLDTDNNLWFSVDQNQGAVLATMVLCRSNQQSSHNDEQAYEPVPSACPFDPRKWHLRYQQLAEIYRRSNANVWFPVDATSQQCVKLLRWVFKNRLWKRQRILPKHLFGMLNNLGFVWERVFRTMLLPTDTDILLGRNNPNVKKPTYRRWLQWADDHYAEYSNASKERKSIIAEEFITEFASRGCRFLKKTPGGEWVPASKREIHSKATQRLREGNPSNHARH